MIPKVIKNMEFLIPLYRVEKYPLKNPKYPLSCGDASPDAPCFKLRR